MSYANDMPTTAMVARTNAGLASELRMQVMRLRRRLASERHPGNDLSLSAMAVLGALYRQGDQPIGALAALEQVQPPSMTRTINCLEEGGYVTRRPHETDGRQILVALTDRGREMLLADRDRRDAWLAVQLSELTKEERDALRRAVPVLEKLTQA
jgi:DNA-binding MarR family transcriptional regulator